MDAAGPLPLARSARGADLPTLLITDRSGAERSVEARSGRSLMENICDAGFDELMAICGGCCSCATCHVYIDPAWTDVVGEPGDDETGLLDSSPHWRTNSRLSCQVEMTDALDRLRLTIAPED